MENLDTDIPPPAAAVEATRAAVGTDEANSWLPFTGMSELKYEVARLIVRRGGPQYDPESEVVITSGEGDNMLDALLALTDPGDEVIVPDPTYAGMLQRVRLAGDVPRLVPLHSTLSRLALGPRRAGGGRHGSHAGHLPRQPVVPVWMGPERRGMDGGAAHLYRAADPAPLLERDGGNRLREEGRRARGAGGCAISRSRWAASPVNSG